MVVSSTNPTFGPKVSPGASPFCEDNGRLLDVAEEWLSAEVVEEIFLGDSVEFLERLGVVPFGLGMGNRSRWTLIGVWQKSELQHVFIVAFRIENP